MRGENGLDLMAFVSGQDLFVAIRWDPCAPCGFDCLHSKTMTLAHIDPTMAEHTVACSKHFVTR